MAPCIIMRVPTFVSDGVMFSSKGGYTQRFNGEGGMKEVARVEEAGEYGARLKEGDPGSLAKGHRWRGSLAPQLHMPKDTSAECSSSMEFQKSYANTDRFRGWQTMDQLGRPEWY